MPTYEYRCPKGHEFEHFFRTISSAESQMKCPECGEVGERRISGGTGLLFKGSGFYITDYGKDGKKDQRRAADSSKSESGGGESSKGESSKGESSKGESSKGESSKGESSKAASGGGESSKSAEKSSSKSSGESAPKKGSGSSDS